jgi:hypothetical protein
MEKDKLIYDIKEQVSAISDDRHLDDRYVEHLIGTARADLYRKMLAKRPGYTTLGMEQNIDVTVESATRSIFSGLTLDCNVLRSTVPMPKLIYEGSLSSYFKVRTADILKNTIEIIDIARANFVVFEFPVVYAFLDYQYYLYFLVPFSEQELKYAVLTGVFEDPMEVDPELTNYPISASDWNTIKPLIINTIMSRPAEDPLNNSEPDLNVGQKAK